MPHSVWVWSLRSLMCCEQPQLPSVTQQWCMKLWGWLVPKPPLRFGILKLHLDGQSWKQFPYLNGQILYPNVNAVIWMVNFYIQMVNAVWKVNFCKIVLQCSKFNVHIWCTCTIIFHVYKIHKTLPFCSKNSGPILITTWSCEKKPRVYILHSG